MKWFRFLFFISLISCEVDKLPSCEGTGIEGQICKEYQYLFGVYNGVNEYDYDLNTGFLSAVITKGDNGSLQGVKSFFYDDDGLLSSVILKNSKGKLISEKIFEYNDSGDLNREVLTGELNTEYKYSYEDGLLKAELFYSNDKLEWIDSLEYFSGTKDIYRKLRYVDNSLLNITYFQIFTNNVLEERVINDAGLIQSRKVIRFNGNKEKIEELIYSGDNTLLNRVVYVYIDKGLDRIEKYNELGEEYELISYKRF
tara:strand:+ start:1999 stop:2763 length:765 start_codon:yes stop_codon:yes gene_type:complete